MFLKVPEGFQGKKFSSCPETKLLPNVAMKSGHLSANIIINRQFGLQDPKVC